MSTPLPDLAKRWAHSFEEDHDDVEVYRPFDYEFPPANETLIEEAIAYFAQKRPAEQSR